MHGAALGRWWILTTVPQRRQRPNARPHLVERVGVIEPTVLLLHNEYCSSIRERPVDDATKASSPSSPRIDTFPPVLLCSHSNETSCDDPRSHHDHGRTYLLAIIGSRPDRQSASQRMVSPPSS